MHEVSLRKTAIFPWSQVVRLSFYCASASIVDAGLGYSKELGVVLFIVYET